MPESGTYPVGHASVMEEESTRLDDLHHALTEYLDGRLSLAPLEESNPKAILELGCGTGLWAIQAANQFPNADVIAVDLHPIPSSKAMPSNMVFRAVDLNEPLPFSENSFDIIHARATIIFVPDPLDVLRRVIPLLRTGGWLVLEDPDMDWHDNSKLGFGPATTRVIDGFRTALPKRNAETGFGLAYDGMLREMGIFDEVNTTKIPLYMSANSDDADLNKLGAAYAVSIVRSAHNLAVKGAFGITPEDARICEEEIACRDMRANVICTWARAK